MLLSADEFFTFLLLSCCHHDGHGLFTQQHTAVKYVVLFSWFLLAYAPTPRRWRCSTVLAEKGAPFGKPTPIRCFRCPPCTNQHPAPHALLSNQVLPLPSTLTHPVALPKAMLLELQHTLMIDAAIEQKQRLKSIFPGFSTPMEGESGPTFMEWAAACVRSRALQLGPQAFAFVPFIDVANHDHERPNADFKVEGEYVVLAAIRRIASGDQVTIRYTGEAGYVGRGAVYLMGCKCFVVGMLLIACICSVVLQATLPLSSHHHHMQGNQSANDGAVWVCARGWQPRRPIPL